MLYFVPFVRSKSLEATNRPSAYTLFTATGAVAEDCYWKLLENEQTE